MEILIDENLPSQIAKGLSELQKDSSIKIIHLTQKFSVGIPDEDWIGSIDGEKSVVVTRDFNIKRTQNQSELIKNSDIGMIFIRGKGLDYWDLVKLIIKHWEEICKVGRKSRPFAYRVSLRSTKLEKLSL